MSDKRGLIFDLRRFSTHDGLGIRTTVFMKGCPLACVWCQNPEGISPVQRPVYFPNKCMRCDNCLRSSKKGGITLLNNQIKLSPTADEGWEDIVYECPTNALVMDSRWMSVEEVLSEIRKDIPFYTYGGGMTISGGEPLNQADFVLDLLIACKKEGISTAIETSMQTSTQNLMSVLPYLEGIYADVKIIDPIHHKNFVGASNELILKNLDFLLHSEYREKVTIRTPMIPGYTDSEANIAAIATLISSYYPSVNYELLNFNPLAQGKYTLLDKEYPFSANLGLFSKDAMNRFAAIAKTKGVINVIIDS